AYYESCTKRCFNNPRRKLLGGGVGTECRPRRGTPHSATQRIGDVEDQMKIPESSCRLLSLLQALKKPLSGDNPTLPSVAKLAKIIPPLYSSLIISIKLEVHLVYEMTVTPPKGHVMALNLIIGCYKLSNALCEGIRICIEVLIIDVNSIQSFNVAMPYMIRRFIRTPYKFASKLPLHPQFIAGTKGCYKLSNALCKGIRIGIEVLIINIKTIILQLGKITHELTSIDQDLRMEARDQGGSDNIASSRCRNGHVTGGSQADNDLSVRDEQQQQPRAATVTTSAGSFNEVIGSGISESFLVGIVKLIDAY
ncbi:hypothetical protein RJ639_043193, partial [Escallonia herrerae]